jgi:hypothetical protein
MPVRAAPLVDEILDRRRRFGRSVWKWCREPRTRIRFAAGLLSLAACVATWLWLDRSGGVVGRPAGWLSRVGIQFDSWGLISDRPSPWRDRWVWTDDPNFLARVDAWRRSLRRPAYENALRQAGGRIVVLYRDGRREEFLFRGPDRPGPGAGGCGGFLYRGHEVQGGEEPFTDFLRGLPPEPPDGGADSEVPSPLHGEP